MFNAIYQSQHGPTVSVTDPKRYIYSQAAYAINILRRHYTMTSHADGAITLAVDGCEPITAEREER